MDALNKILSCRDDYLYRKMLNYTYEKNGLFTNTHLVMLRALQDSNSDTNSPSMQWVSEFVLEKPSIMRQRNSVQKYWENAHGVTEFSNLMVNHNKLDTHIRYCHVGITCCWYGTRPAIRNAGIRKQQVKLLA